MDDAVLAGFVLHTTQEFDGNVKKAITKFSSHLDGDDRLYVYSPDSHEVTLARGRAIGVMLNSRPSAFDVGDAVRHSVLVMDELDEVEYKKVLFVITDKFKKDDLYNCKKAVRHDREEEFNFVFICLGDCYEHVNCDRIVKVFGNIGKLYTQLMEKVWPDLKVVEDVIEEVVRSKVVYEPMLLRKQAKPVEAVKPDIIENDFDFLDEEEDDGELEQCDDDNEEHETSSS